MKEIILSRGLRAIVDDIDYEYLINLCDWFANPTGDKFRAQGQVKKFGYRRTVSMHRLIMQSIVGDMPKKYEVDHINRNSLDNRRDNLRICTRNGNNQNKGKNVNGITSQYKGVCWNKKNNNWLAQITINSKQTYIGSFKVEADAAKAYNEMALKHYGEFAVLNTVESDQ